LLTPADVSLSLLGIAIPCLESSRQLEQLFR